MTRADLITAVICYKNDQITLNELKQMMAQSFATRDEWEELERRLEDQTAYSDELSKELDHLKASISMRDGAAESRNKPYDGSQEQKALRIKALEMFADIIDSIGEMKAISLYNGGCIAIHAKDGRSYKILHLPQNEVNVADVQSFISASRADGNKAAL